MSYRCNIGFCDTNHYHGLIDKVAWKDSYAYLRQKGMRVQFHLRDFGKRDDENIY